MSHIFSSPHPGLTKRKLRKLRKMIVQNPLMPATVATVHPLWEPTGTVFRHWITNSLMTTFAEESSQLECLVCCEPLHCDHGVIPDQLVVVSQSPGHNPKRNSNIRSGVICLTCTLIHSEEELHQRALKILGLGGVQ